MISARHDAALLGGDNTLAAGYYGYQGEPDMVRALRYTVEEATRGLIDDVKGHLSQAWCGEFWTRHACVAQRVSL
jgi:hypothetical protein